MVEKKRDAIEKRSAEVSMSMDFGELYATVRDGQIMEPVRGRVTLFQALGHIYELRKGSGDWRITAMGYRYANRVSSISLVTPQSVIVDGHPVPNPRIERNKKTKAIESVNLRRMGIGFSSIGNIVVIDKTLFYNVYTYFIQSIQAKMSRNSACAQYGFAATAPEGDSWAWYATEPPLGIWINYKDKDILDCLQEHTQRQRFGDRIATTILDRNILKDHPAIAAAQVHPRSGEGGIKATIVVYGYRNAAGPKDLSDIMRQAEGGGKTDDFEIKAETIAEIREEDEKEAFEEAEVGELAGGGDESEGQE